MGKHNLQEHDLTCYDPTRWTTINKNRRVAPEHKSPIPKIPLSSSSSQSLIQKTMSLLHLQLPLSQFKSLTLSTPFLHGTSTINLTKPPPSATVNHHHHHRHTYLPPIRAMRSLQGRVICTTNDKTVNVEVTRLAPHPKYKRRVRKKKKFQAHDPENQFQIGDLVQLEKCKPISKKKTFLAIPIPKRNAPKQKQESQDLGLALESDSASQV